MTPDTDAVPETLPAASTAATPNEYDVPQVSPVNEKLVEVGDPTCDPFTNTRYPATPTLSDEADHDNVNPVCDTPLVTNPDGTDGGEISEHAEVAPLTDAVPDTFPAPSTAATPNVYDVPHDNPLNKYPVDNDVPTWPPFKNMR